MDEARQRSGQTKRARSREALLTAAAEVFKRGWPQARVEDIAREAGLRPSTAYNHFPGGKAELLGHVYAPRVEPLVKMVEEHIAAGAELFWAVEQHVQAAAAVAREDMALTSALLVAAMGEAMRTDGSPLPEPGDVRTLVRWNVGLERLVAWGQEQGTFRDYPSAFDVSVYHVNALLLRVMLLPAEPAAETAAVVLSQLVPSLRP